MYTCFLNSSGKAQEVAFGSSLWPASEDDLLIELHKVLFETFVLHLMTVIKHFKKCTF